jgi:hypothetical protein
MLLLAAKAGRGRGTAKSDSKILSLECPAERPAVKDRDRQDRDPLRLTRYYHSLLDAGTFEGRAALVRFLGGSRARATQSSIASESGSQSTNPRQTRTPASRVSAREARSEQAPTRHPRRVHGVSEAAFGELLPMLDNRFARSGHAHLSHIGPTNLAPSPFDVHRAS